MYNHKRHRDKVKQKAGKASFGLCGGFFNAYPAHFHKDKMDNLKNDVSTLVELANKLQDSINEFDVLLKIKYGKGFTDGFEKGFSEAISIQKPQEHEF